MAMADRWFLMPMPFVSVTIRGTVGGEDDFVRPERMGQAGQGHFLAQAQRVEERLELGVIRMIGNVPGIQEFHGQFAPFPLVEAAQPGRMKFLVEQTAFAANEVDVKIIRLQTVDDRGAFAHPCSDLARP